MNFKTQEVEDDWINEYELKTGDYDVTNVDREIAPVISQVLKQNRRNPYKHWVTLISLYSVMVTFLT